MNTDDCSEFGLSGLGSPHVITSHALSRHDGPELANTDIDGEPPVQTAPLCWKSHLLFETVIS